MASYFFKDESHGYPKYTLTGLAQSLHVSYRLMITPTAEAIDHVLNNFILYINVDQSFDSGIRYDERKIVVIYNPGWAILLGVGLLRSDIGIERNAIAHANSCGNLGIRTGPATWRNSVDYPVSRRTSDEVTAITNIDQYGCQNKAVSE